MSVWMITMLIFIMSPIVLAQHAATIIIITATAIATAAAHPKARANGKPNKIECSFAQI